MISHTTESSWELFPTLIEQINRSIETKTLTLTQADGPIVEGDVIVFRLKPVLELDKIASPEEYKHTYYGMNNVPVFFVVQYLGVINGNLYYFHNDEIKRIPIVHLMGENYFKVTGITF